MLNSLNMSDPISDACINTFQNSIFNSNPNLSMTDYNNNNLVRKPEETDVLYQDISIDNSIDLSINFEKEPRNDVSKVKTFNDRVTPKSLAETSMSISNENNSESTTVQNSDLYPQNHPPSLQIQQQNYHMNYRDIPNRETNFSNFPSGYVGQQSMPFLSSSFTANSTCCQNTKQPTRFGSTASSLSSNILLSSSSSSFSSFSSNFSNESQLARQNNLHQYQNFQGNQPFNSLARPQNEYNRPASASTPASSLGMHRASLPITFHSTRTLTDIVSLEQLPTSTQITQQFPSSPMNHQTSLNPNTNNTSNQLDLTVNLDQKNTTSQSPGLESETNCLSAFVDQSQAFDATKQSGLNLDEFNLATPTELTPLTDHLIMSNQQQDLLYNTPHQQPSALDTNTSNKTPSHNQQKTHFNNNTYSQFYNDMTPSYLTQQVQSSHNQHHYNPLISNGIHVGGTGHNLNNSQISMMIPTPTGFFSRSNSQPDLTLNLEKATPNSNTYNINNNYCYYFNSNSSTSNISSNNSHVYNSNFNNCFNTNTNNISQTTYNSNAYGPNPTCAGQSMNKTGKAKRLVRRHPSLSMSYKTSMYENNEQDEEFLADFNIIDYLNSTSSAGITNGNPNEPNQIQQNNACVNYNNNNNNVSGGPFEKNQVNCFSLENSSNQTANTCLNKTASNSTNNDLATIGSSNLIDDGLFLGTDALTDFLTNCGTLSDLFDDLPEIEDLMSLVTFESSSSNTATSAGSNTPMNEITTNCPEQVIKQHSQCDMNLPDLSKSVFNSTKDCYPLSNYYDYCNTESSNLNQNGEIDEIILEDESSERTTRSAPPSPTPQKKKQRPTTNLPWNKPWNKMDENEQSKAVDCLTRIINDEMGLREQLEIIRILNPDAKLKPTDKQFVINLKIIDDEKYKRIKDIIKAYGLYSNDRQMNDNSSDCSANSCPQSYHLAKREQRIKRAQQRFKLKCKKEQRQIIKETKSGLFAKTEVVPLSQVLPEEDIEVDILS